MNEVVVLKHLAIIYLYLIWKVGQFSKSYLTLKKLLKPRNEYYICMCVYIYVYRHIRICTCIYITHIQIIYTYIYDCYI